MAYPFLCIQMFFLFAFCSKSLAQSKYLGIKEQAIQNSRSTTLSDVLLSFQNIVDSIENLIFSKQKLDLRRKGVISTVENKKNELESLDPLKMEEYKTKNAQTVLLVAAKAFLNPEIILKNNDLKSLPGSPSLINCLNNMLTFFKHLHKRQRFLIARRLISWTPNRLQLLYQPCQNCKLKVLNKVKDGKWIQLNKKICNIMEIVENKYLKGLDNKHDNLHAHANQETLGVNGNMKKQIKKFHSVQQNHPNHFQMNTLFENGGIILGLRRENQPNNTSLNKVRYDLNEIYKEVGKKLKDQEQKLIRVKSIIRKHKQRIRNSKKKRKSKKKKRITPKQILRKGFKLFSYFLHKLGFNVTQASNTRNKTTKRKYKLPKGKLKENSLRFKSQDLSAGHRVKHSRSDIRPVIRMIKKEEIETPQVFSIGRKLLSIEGNNEQEELQTDKLKSLEKPKDENIRTENKLPTISNIKKEYNANLAPKSLNNIMLKLKQILRSSNPNDAEVFTKKPNARKEMKNKKETSVENKKEKIYHNNIDSKMPVELNLNKKKQFKKLVGSHFNPSQGRAETFNNIALLNNRFNFMSDPVQDTLHHFEDNEDDSKVMENDITSNLDQNNKVTGAAEPYNGNKRNRVDTGLFMHDNTGLTKAAKNKILTLVNELEFYKKSLPLSEIVPSQTEKLLRSWETNKNSKHKFLTKSDSLALEKIQRLSMLLVNNFLKAKHAICSQSKINNKNNLDSQKEITDEAIQNHILLSLKKKNKEMNEKENLTFLKSLLKRQLSPSRTLLHRVKRKGKKKGGGKKGKKGKGGDDEGGGGGGGGGGKKGKKEKAPKRGNEMTKALSLIDHNAFPEAWDKMKKDIRELQRKIGLAVTNDIKTEREIQKLITEGDVLSTKIKAVKGFATNFDQRKEKALAKMKNELKKFQNKVSRLTAFTEKSKYPAISDKLINRLREHRQNIDFLKAMLAMHEHDQTYHGDNSEFIEDKEHSKVEFTLEQPDNRFDEPRIKVNLKPHPQHQFYMPGDPNPYYENAKQMNVITLGKDKDSDRFFEQEKRVRDALKRVGGAAFIPGSGGTFNPDSELLDVDRILSEVVDRNLKRKRRRRAIQNEVNSILERVKNLTRQKRIKRATTKEGFKIPKEKENEARVKPEDEIIPDASALGLPFEDIVTNRNEVSIENNPKLADPELLAEYIKATKLGQKHASKELSGKQLKKEKTHTDAPMKTEDLPNKEKEHIEPVDKNRYSNIKVTNKDDKKAVMETLDEEPGEIMAKLIDGNFQDPIPPQVKKEFSPSNKQYEDLYSKLKAEEKARIKIQTLRDQLEREDNIKAIDKDAEKDVPTEVWDKESQSFVPYPTETISYRPRLPATEPIKRKNKYYFDVRKENIPTHEHPQNPAAQKYYIDDSTIMKDIQLLFGDQTSETGSMSPPKVGEESISINVKGRRTFAPNENSDFQMKNFFDGENAGNQARYPDQTAKGFVRQITNIQGPSNGRAYNVQYFQQKSANKLVPEPQSQLDNLITSIDDENKRLRHLWGMAKAKTKDYIQTSQNVGKHMEQIPNGRLSENEKEFLERIPGAAEVSPQYRPVRRQNTIERKDTVARSLEKKENLNLQTLLEALSRNHNNQVYNRK